MFYVDHNKENMVTTETSGDKNANEERRKSDHMTPERRKKSQPAGTIEYTVRLSFSIPISVVEKINNLTCIKFFSEKEVQKYPFQKPGYGLVEWPLMKISETTISLLMHIHDTGIGVFSSIILGLRWY